MRSQEKCGRSDNELLPGVIKHVKDHFKMISSCNNIR